MWMCVVVVDWCTCRKLIYSSQNPIKLYGFCPHTVNNDIVCVCLCVGSEVWHPMCKEAARLERKLRVSDTQNTHNPLLFLSVSYCLCFCLKFLVFLATLFSNQMSLLQLMIFCILSDFTLIFFVLLVETNLWDNLHFPSRLLSSSRIPSPSHLCEYQPRTDRPPSMLAYGTK